MARTILQIYDQIISEKENQTSLSGLLPQGETSQNLLNDLTSNSKVAVWRLWAYTVAVAIHIHEQYWDIFLTDIKELIRKAPTGTPAWYQRMILEWQYGDSLVWLNNKYVFNPIDLAKRIVTACAVTERGDGVVIIKVAKGTETLTKLTAVELQALESYVHKIKFAGTRIDVISIDPDQLTVNFDIYYDPITTLPIVKQNVQAAVDSYLKNLPFNGAFNITRFTDVLQQATGVVDPVYQQSSIQPHGGDLKMFTVETVPAAGHMVLSAALDTIFTYKPKV